MKKFTGNKTVKACPMTLGEAEKILNRHIDIPSFEIRYITPGYLVEYGEDVDNYRSWLPVEVFELTYRPSDNYYERMLIEKEEVCQRYLDGRKFSFSPAFRKLTELEQTLILQQLNAMEQYLYFLTKRIDHAAEKQDLAMRTAVASGRNDVPLAQCTGTV